MKLAVMSKAIGAATLAFAIVAPVQAATKAATAIQAQAAPAMQLKRLADDYYMSKARFDPTYASFFGDTRFDDQIGMSIGPAERARRQADFRQFAQRLRAIDPSKLERDDRISYKILDHEFKAGLENLRFPDHLLPIDQMMFTMPMLLANLANGKSFQSIETPAQYRAFLSRIKQLTPWIDQAIANMREGVKTGIVLPKSLIVAALPQYQALISKTAGASPFYAAIPALPAGLADADKRRLAADYAAEIDQRLNPALARLVRFLEQDYLPAGRATSGIGALPNGAAWYRAKVADNTTTTLAPEAIHAIGLAEVARIQALLAAVGPKLGYDGPAAGLPKWVGEQPRYKPFKDDQEILDAYRKLDTVLSARLPAFFTLVPRAALEQRLEPELTRATASDHYTGPSIDGKRPGIFWSVVNGASTYDSTKMTSLYMHEGRPGHHFQIALQLEKSLPDFRRFGGNNAYIEGWALYAETLGVEMGVFDDPAQYFGHLNSELLRAARLVVDTGLHAKGWSREQAIAYLRETNGYSEAVARNAIERYMAWPGQALGYKVGALKIAELRQRASAALGPKFDLPSFHAVVLGDGTLPLAVLEENVDRWIAASKK
ncbi:DUF885 domain-containing protein [Massilia yuzhufengensis]|uniref:Uncharacterized conserved protein, DUF885 familyt n=1 Tax=Massilia yuzhufengensis TaxID=1164594 RepID=A0A1I1RGY2_9BURK|nr:DUF885 domain-containing protein [Massilia yuzhufengensis]SFD33571.1 Uncharacterized conserved protein, DUF885 familyt [Massilia yuzhufengensis]